MLVVRLAILNDSEVAYSWLSYVLSRSPATSLHDFQLWPKEWAATVMAPLDRAWQAAVAHHDCLAIPSPHAHSGGVGVSRARDRRNERTTRVTSPLYGSKACTVPKHVRFGAGEEVETGRA